VSLRLMKTGIGITLVAAAVASAFAGTARADGGGTCPAQTLVQPFTLFGDTEQYYLGPSGSFESGTTGWTVSGSVAVVSGNETSYVNSASDTHALQLGPGASAQTPQVCVTKTTPMMRTFLRNVAGDSSKLKVDLLYTNSSGRQKSATVAELGGTSSWSLSSPVRFLDPIENQLDKNGYAWVSFKFSPEGKSTWLIDDWYVDPRKHSKS
jgi:hypothetical protein